MKDVIEAARYRKKVTQKYVSGKLFLSVRQYQRLINGEQEMTPEMALRIADILDCPPITMVYCRKYCAIGHRYAFDLLNNVDTSPIAILAKYRMEEQEAHEALNKLVLLFLNKRDKNDCNKDELEELGHWALEMLDLEHVIETLKFRLWDFLNVTELIREHNGKCVIKGYVDEKKPELQLAG